MTRVKKLTLFLPFIFFSSSTVFGEDTNIRSLGAKYFEPSMLVSRMCIGEYEFVILCKGNATERCLMQHQNFQITQTFTKDGEGKKC